MLARYPWLEPYADVPNDAAAPLAMSPPPADAVDSYGKSAVEWVETTQRITLRWWQALSITRQLEHRADGSLCHRAVVESTPRRAGKSVRIRAMALWRLAHAELFGEPQVVIHTGSDVAICREIQRGAWRWCEETAGWSVSRANGKEAVETPTEDRWLVRAQRAVYGYDVCLGIVDEGWDVEPDTVSEGLEPALMERSSPQIHMTSTAHRRATSLMRSALLHAFGADDPETLLLLWGARPGSDPADPAVWKASSPHWSDDRRKMIAAKYEKALAGEDDPELDDPDPMRGFEAQYLNVWRLRERRSIGEPVISEAGWAALEAAAPARPPDAVAVEDWFARGVSVALAWRVAGRAVVAVSAYDSVAGAARAVREAGYTRAVLAGSSIAGDPAWKAEAVKVEAHKGTVRGAVEDLSRLLTDDALRHNGGPDLSAQVLELRTSPGVDGPRVRTTSAADGVKAAVWAALAARVKVRHRVVVL
ncbi:MAG TPA: HNH endonuclease [Planctomycetota bacterium]|nr:HNH endonuclease [Planctomycetota bacterium]